MKKPLQNFAVYQRGSFWFYARGVSAAQVHNSVWWRIKSRKRAYFQTEDGLHKDEIRVDGPVSLKGS